MRWKIVEALNSFFFIFNKKNLLNVVINDLLSLHKALYEVIIFAVWFVSAARIFLNDHSFHYQGLRPGVPAESPAMVFASPTKLVSENSSSVEYLGRNNVNEIQKLFQVITRLK